MEEKVNFSEFQCGGRKQRSTIDQIFIVKAILDNQKCRHQNTYMLFGDAEKCFDKLWLQDCIIDIYEAGIPAKDAMMIYNLNRKAVVSIATPVGKTDDIHIEEIVKQGTIYGPKLCCAATDKVNVIDETNFYKINDLDIKNLIYVDNILGSGSKNDVLKLANNLRRMEEEKKFTFNVEKTAYMIVKTSRKKEEEIDIKLKKGKIKRVSSYKYLGIWISEKGNLNKHLEEIEKKIPFMLNEVKRLGDPYRVGVMASQIQLKMFEVIIMPSLLYAMEAWSKFRVEDTERFEIIQGKFIKSIFGLTKSTPYWGVIAECGIWPIEDRINEKKLMWYYSLIQSEESRLARKVLFQQKQHPTTDNWYKVIEEIISMYNIEENEERIKKLKKAEWKKEVQTKITQKIYARFNEKKTDMKKLRFIEQDDKWKKKTYIRECRLDEIRDIMKMKLNMLDVADNYGKKTCCNICKETPDTTEHLMMCPKTKNSDFNIDMLKSNDSDILRKLCDHVLRGISYRNCLKV